MTKVLALDASNNMIEVAGCEGVNPTWRDRWTFVKPALSLFAQPYMDETLGYAVMPAGSNIGAIYGGGTNALVSCSTSADGVTYTLSPSGVVTSSLGARVVSAATNGSGRWAVVYSPGSSDPAMYLAVSSNDGVSFSTTGGTTSNTQEWRVVRTQLGFLAIRNDGTQIRRSLDSSPNWSTGGLTAPALSVGSVASVGDTVIVASNTTFRMSTNAGASWGTNYTVPAGTGRALASSNGVFFLVPTTSSSAGSSVYTSTDGMTWTERPAILTVAGSAVPESRVVYDGTYWFIPFGSNAWVSTDLVTWNQLPISSAPADSLCYASGRMLYSQYNSTTLRSQINRLVISPSAKELGYDLPV